MTTLEGVRRTLGYYLTQPLMKLLARTSVTPNMITCFGVLISISAGVVIALGHPFIAGFIVLVGGFFDTIDGALARYTGQTSRFGAILDSTLDRLAEAAVLLGLIVYYAAEQSVPGIVVAGIVWIASMLVSYIRARAEAMGLDCTTGLFTRAERIVIMVLGLLLSRIDSALLIALSVVAALSVVTVVQRLHHVWNQTKTG
ncbi:MAG TPA: CDP-alcohol phosphatidyltransferase family protein [Dehalococcoidia bacterium]|nr:CDP-alcohol phosphatidyltransferase family protein [Dehalococcoidia bacterium]